MDSSPSIKGKERATTDLSNDLEFKLEFDIEEDIEGELEDFVRLARLGFYRRARDYFEENLAAHLDLFPVLAEYAEFLLSQSEYKEVLNILPESQDQSGFSEAEWWLVRLLKACARIKCGKEAERNLEGLETARTWYRMQGSSNEEYDEVELHCLEIYLRILVHVERLNSYFLEPFECRYPPTRNESEGQKWLGFEQLVSVLLRQGKVWEARNIAHILLEGPCDSGTAHDVYMAFCRGIEQIDDLDKIHVAARLGVNNAYVTHNMLPGDIKLTDEEIKDLVTAILEDLVELLTEEPHEFNDLSVTSRQNLSRLGELKVKRRSQRSPRPGSSEDLSPMPNLEAAGIHTFPGSGLLLALPREEKDLTGKSREDGDGGSQSQVSREEEHYKARDEKIPERKGLSTKRPQEGEEDNARKATEKGAETLQTGPHRPIYMRCSTKDLLPETLNYYGVTWEWDRDNSDYIIIKKDFAFDIEDRLFKHTRILRRKGFVTRHAADSHTMPEDINNVLDKGKQSHKH